MSIESRLSQDLKAAMLAGQQQHVMTLRGLKSSLLYEKVAKKLPREEELAESAAQAVLARESKKRQESADLYKSGGRQDKAEAELAEKAIIDKYLPAQLSKEDIGKLVDEAVAATGASSPAQLGQVIGLVRQKAGASADGALIAQLVKEKLSQ